MKNNDSSFQNMMLTVEKIVSDISHNDCDLDMVISKVEQGYDILKNMKQRLNEASNKIEKLRHDYENHDKIIDNEKD